MFKKLSFLLLILAMLYVVGCSAHTHNVGHGIVLYQRPVVERQWYLLYGVLPLNHVNTHVMAEGKRHYQITTLVTPIDDFYNFLFPPFTLTSRTVIVRR